MIAGLKSKMRQSSVPIFLIIVGLMFTIVVGARSAGPGSCPPGAYPGSCSVPGP